MDEKIAAASGICWTAGRMWRRGPISRVECIRFQRPGVSATTKSKSSEEEIHACCELERWFLEVRSFNPLRRAAGLMEESVIGSPPRVLLSRLVPQAYWNRHLLGTVSRRSTLSCYGSTLARPSGSAALPFF